MDDSISVEVTCPMAYYVREGLQEALDDELLAVYRNLKLKMAGVLLAPGSSQKVVLTLEELWMLEGFVKDTAQVGKEPVGKQWLAVILSGLLHLEAGTQVHDAVVQVGDGMVEEAPLAGRAAGRLAMWPGRNDGG